VQHPVRLQAWAEEPILVQHRVAKVLRVFAPQSGAAVLRVFLAAAGPEACSVGAISPERVAAWSSALREKPLEVAAAFSRTEVKRLDSPFDAARQIEPRGAPVFGPVAAEQQALEPASVEQGLAAQGEPVASGQPLLPVRAAPELVPVAARLPAAALQARV
jgi:hypothetical protein